MLSEQELIDNYRQVVSHIRIGSKKYSHQTDLLAVSKTKPAAAVKVIYDQGQRHFGENYLQDGLEKVEALSHLPDIEWHFIGAIQSNKTKPIAQHFHWVETLERDKIAKRLNDQRPAGLPPLNVLIQINISGEEQKAGIMISEAETFATQLLNYPNLALRGLMCIPSPPNKEDDRHSLASQMSAMQSLMKKLQAKFPSIDTLSMGMSNDLDLAIQHGSTQVRIGTDIFGARENLTKD